MLFCIELYSNRSVPAEGGMMGLLVKVEMVLRTFSMSTPVEDHKCQSEEHPQSMYTTPWSGCNFAPVLQCLYWSAYWHVLSATRRWQYCIHARTPVHMM